MTREEKLVKVVWFDEAAIRFHVKPATLREWIAEGRFPSPRGMGNTLFYTEAELDDIVEHAFLGRWGPRQMPAAPTSETSGKTRKDAAKGGKDEDLEGSTR